MTREEAIKWQEAFKKTYGNFPPEAAAACDMAIEALQEQERKRGKWIVLDSNEDGNLCKCPECGEEFMFYNGEFATKYCGECGADMRGEQK